MGSEYFILMADIIKSREKDQRSLMNEFKDTATRINKTAGTSFLSPVTITLGDEFQSVLGDPQKAIDAIFQIEEEIIISKKKFKLRYALMKGRIDTQINMEIAHEMMGSGLTETRQALNKMKKGKLRFYIDIGNKKTSEALINSFMVYQTIVDNWRIEKDYALVGQFMEHFDYKVVAEELDKTRSQIWKRKKSLMIEEYFALKKVIKHIGGGI